MSNTKVRLPFLAYGMVSKWWNEYQDVVEVVVVDVEPYLDSRNTKGYGTATQIIKAQSGNTCRSMKRVSNGGGIAEVVMVYRW